MTRALALALLLAACADRSGMAGCFERMADGRVIYRAGFEPMVSGFCPTLSEAIAAHAVRPAEPCGTACQLRAWRALME